MPRFIRTSSIALLGILILASSVLVATPQHISRNLALPGATIRASVSPFVFGPETPASGSLLGLANPVVAIVVTYVDLQGASITSVDFHLDSLNLTSAGTFNNTAFIMPVGFALRNGPHDAEFALVDSLGAAGSHDWNFTVDAVPPVLIVTSPAYPAVPTAAVPVQGTALPALMAADPVMVTVTALPSHLALQTQAINGTGSFGLVMPLSEGTNILFVNATDAAGNLATVIKTIVSDTIKPTLTVLTPANLSVSPANVVRVAGITEFGAYLTVNGFAVAVAPNGTWSVNLALPEGVNIIQVAAADQVGNLNYAIVVVFVDSDVPRIVLTSPLPALTNRSSINISGTANDTKLVALFVRYNQNLRQLAFDPVTGRFDTTLAGLPDGSYTVEIVAVDAAQHTAVLTAVVVVDTSPPVVKLSLPPDGLETNQSSVRLVGTVDDANATVLVNDQLLRPDASGDWATTVALVQGSNAIRISAVDAAGNHAAPLLIHVTYYSPYSALANQTAANSNNVEALAAFARLSLVGILLLVLAVVFVLYARTERRLKENRRILVAIARATKPKGPPPAR